MDDLHDALEAGGYKGHELERFLVRVLFCLFAEDTGIFEREAFRLYIEDRTKPDGSDLGPHLARLFDVLNTPAEKRQAESRRNAGRVPLRQRRSLCRAPGFCRLQPRHAQQPAGLHAVRLVVDLAGHLRVSLSGRDGAARAPANRRPLHQRARHPESRSRPVPRRPAGRVRTHQGQQEPTEAVSPEARRAALPRPRLRLRQLPGHHLPGAALAGDRGARRRCTRQPAATGTGDTQIYRWWTWTPSSASRSASGRPGSPRWPCG